MTAGELAVVLAALLCCIGFAALVVVLMRVLDSLKALRGEVESLRCRFDRVLGSAEAISGAVAGGSRIARAALSAPVIKTVAIGTGTRRAVRRLGRKEKKIA